MLGFPVLHSTQYKYIDYEFKNVNVKIGIELHEIRHYCDLSLNPVNEGLYSFLKMLTSCSRTILNRSTI